MSMTGTNITPLGDRVLVKQDAEPQKTEGGLYLPNTAQEAPQLGVVVRAGSGKVMEDGKLRPLTVKQGDKVIFGKYTGTKVKMGQDELLFMREEDILGIVEA